MVPRNPPVTVTVVPPAATPADGVTLITTVGGLHKLEVAHRRGSGRPIRRATVTAHGAGSVRRGHRLDLGADLTTYDLAVVVPKLTCCTVVNPDPVIVTEVPPDVGPLVREREVIRGSPLTGPAPSTRGAAEVA